MAHFGSSWKDAVKTSGEKEGKEGESVRKRGREEETVEDGEASYIVNDNDLSRSHRVERHSQAKIATVVTKAAAAAARGAAAASGVTNTSAASAAAAATAAAAAVAAAAAAVALDAAAIDAGIYGCW